MEPNSTPSTLDLVVIHGSTAGQWITLPASYPLSQLRDNFWNYSVGEEEKEWRRGRPESKTMEVDEDDEDDENIGTEIGPGCYPLDLNIRNLGFSDLLERQDYIRIYDFCNKLYNTLKDNYCGTPPSVFITGQPGTGKWLLVRSFWL